MEVGFFLFGEFCMYNYLVVIDSKFGKVRELNLRI